MRKLFLAGPIAPIALVLLLVGCGGGRDASKHHRDRVIVQLNWLHDPTFTGEYLWARADSTIDVVLREGGPNISALAEVGSGRADIAVVGADIFLRYIASRAPGEGSIVAVGVEFQRNPVGWVLHPEAARKAGLSDWQGSTNRELNSWLFAKAAAGEISVGDKRGTETTAVWLRWARLHHAVGIELVPVGFDASLVLSAPMLAYPVYLNEEPYRLEQKLGESLVVFDPAADGVEMYGNVLVCRRQFYESRPDIVRHVVLGIAKGWELARRNVSEAVRAVMKYYSIKDSVVVRRQIVKTLEFVYFGDPGRPEVMDTSVGGGWDKTLDALQSAGALEREVTHDELVRCIAGLQ